MQPPDPHDVPANQSFDLADPLADQDRAAAAIPSKETLEHELPGGCEAHDAYAALRVPAFRLFAIAFFLSAIGTQVEIAAVGWEIYKRSHSSLDLGWLGLVLAIPMLILSLPAGHLADFYSRKRLFLFMQVSTTICAIGLMIVSWRFSGTAHSIGVMYGLLAFGAIGATLGRPGREALMAQLVPNETYPNAVTWNATSFELSSMTGPALGGMIVWLASPAVAYAVAAVAFVISFVLILFLPDSIAERRGNTAGFSDLVAGIRFVFRTKLLLAALTLDLFAVLFGGATFLLPLFAADILHVGAFGFGCLRAAPSIGAVSMALAQAHLPPFKRAGRTLLIAVTGFGMATIVFGLSKSYTLSFCMLILTGMTDNISVVIRHSLAPLLTPDRMRGRVMAVNQIFVGSSNELGGLESGLTAYWLGPVQSVVYGGIASILVVIAIALRYPQVRKLTSLHDVEPDEAEAMAIEAQG